MPALCETDRLSPSRPAGRPIGYHHWHDLSFIHWRLPCAVVEPLLPAGLTLDTFDGDAWVGLVPFSLSGVRPWWSPAVPGVSRFHETNLRTYVHREGRDPGVWFFSLEAARSVAVLAARWGWGLAYYRARMSIERAKDSISYRSGRLWPGPRGAAVSAEVSIGPRWETNGLAQPGTLEHFLIERYVLYSMRRGRLLRARVHHDPYVLHEAHVERLDESLSAAAGLDISGPPCHALFSPGVRVEVFPLVAVEP